eukprot:gene14577-17227_t
MTIGYLVLFPPFEVPALPGLPVLAALKGKPAHEGACKLRRWEHGAWQRLVMPGAAKKSQGEPEFVKKPYVCFDVDPFETQHKVMQGLQPFDNSQIVFPSKDT